MQRGTFPLNDVRPQLRLVPASELSQTLKDNIDGDIVSKSADLDERWHPINRILYSHIQFLGRLFNLKKWKEMLTKVTEPSTKMR